ncbi:DUF3606 domain-containing protein [Ideonella sp. BN130291]|uniref:DUF3606 domain-containing protein n=1 Tax=Ideonella sp. BN130291 TaxID=3112940 RepID=UPI002E26FA39|nr:DUF3606 domain-containing protein [Ideonella sp. BN130291]
MHQPTPLPATAPAATLQPDTARIEMRRDTDIAYWCRVLDVSPAELRRAVQHVGPQVAAVRRHLRREPPLWVHDSGF